MPQSPTDTEYHIKTAIEVNGTSTVLKEVLDGENLTMDSIVVSDTVVVDPERNPLEVAQFTLQINVQTPLTKPIPPSPLPLIAPITTTYNLVADK